MAKEETLADFLEPAEKKSDEQIWHERRNKGIGGSDAPILCGLAAWKSPMELWAEKTGVVQRSSGSGLSTDWLDLGNFIEPFIVEKYQERSGCKVVRQGRFRKHPTIAFMQCNLDGKCIDPVRGEGVWEAKFINPFMAGDWNEDTGELPEKYRCQVQHNMAVTGYDYADVAALIFGKGLVVMRIERDQEYIDALIETETEFWAHVQDKTPPPATGNDTKFMEQVYKQDPLGIQSINLPIDIELIDEELIKVKDVIKASELRKSDLEVVIKETMGSAVFGVLPSGVKYTWKDQTRESFTVKASTTRVLRRTDAPKPKAKGKVKP